MVEISCPTNVARKKGFNGRKLFFFLLCTILHNDNNHVSVQPAVIVPYPIVHCNNNKKGSKMFCIKFYPLHPDSTTSSDYWQKQRRSSSSQIVIQKQGRWIQQNLIQLRHCWSPTMLKLLQQLLQRDSSSLLSVVSTSKQDNRSMTAIEHNNCSRSSIHPLKCFWFVVVVVEHCKEYFVKDEQ